MCMCKSWLLKLLPYLAIPLLISCTLWVSSIVNSHNYHIWQGGCWQSISPYKQSFKIYWHSGLTNRSSAGQAFLTLATCDLDQLNLPSYELKWPPARHRHLCMESALRPSTQTSQRTGGSLSGFKNVCCKPWCPLIAQLHVAHNTPPSWWHLLPLPLSHVSS